MNWYIHRRWLYSKRYKIMYRLEFREVIVYHILANEAIANENQIPSHRQHMRDLKDIHIYTYIIGHYNPSVRIIDLVSHTTYVVCVNFYT